MGGCWMVGKGDRGRLALGYCVMAPGLISILNGKYYYTGIASKNYVFWCNWDENGLWFLSLCNGS